MTAAFSNQCPATTHLQGRIEHPLKETNRTNGTFIETNRTWGYDTTYTRFQPEEQSQQITKTSYSLIVTSNNLTRIHDNLNTFTHDSIYARFTISNTTLSFRFRLLWHASSKFASPTTICLERPSLLAVNQLAPQHGVRHLIRPY